jgi:hypothetical protein
MNVRKSWRQFVRNTEFARDCYRDVSLTARIALYEKGLQTKAALNKSLGVYTLADSDLAIEMAVKNDPRYHEREQLRAESNTEQGISWTRSNLIGTVVYTGTGMIAAKGIHMLAEYALPQSAAETHNTITAWGTFLTQLGVSWGSMISNEIRERPNFYRAEHGGIDWRKTTKGFGGFLLLNGVFDVAWGPVRSYFHKSLMDAGIQESMASMQTDLSIGVPIYYALAMQMGTAAGLLERPKKYDSE